jgi:dihydrofolate reductase
MNKITPERTETMRSLTVLTFLSMDGVMQAPGSKGEDPSGGFYLEGWSVPGFDDVLGEEMGKQMTPPFDLLLGRKTYDIFASHWPEQGENDPFKQSRKYVVSNNPVDSDWEGTIPIEGDPVTEIRKLKAQEGPPIQVHGSSHLIQTLLVHDLVDELWLKIFPVTLGKGKRLFGKGTVPAAFKLTESNITPKGVIIASYRRDGEIETGSF